MFFKLPELGCLFRFLRPCVRGTQCFQNGSSFTIWRTENCLPWLGLNKRSSETKVTLLIHCFSCFVCLCLARVILLMPCVGFTLWAHRRIWQSRRKSRPEALSSSHAQWELNIPQNIAAVVRLWGVIWALYLISLITLGPFFTRLCQRGLWWNPCLGC